MPIRIPKSDIPILLELTKMSDEQFNQLKAAVESADINLDLDLFTASVSQQSDMDAMRVKNFLQILAGMLGAWEKFGLTQDEFLEELKSTLEADSDEDCRTILENWNTIYERVCKFSDIEYPLVVFAKAVGLLSEFDNRFLSSRIITDIRPIFLKNVDLLPEYNLLIHNLRISYHAPDGRHVDTVITLDSDDLRVIKKMVERAIVKERALNQKLLDKGLKCVNITDDKE